MTEDDVLFELLARIHEKFPLIPYIARSRCFSMVRRMTAEKKYGIPIHLRSGYAISVKTGKAANKMNEQEWEKFYAVLCKELKEKYPENYSRAFNIEDDLDK